MCQRCVVRGAIFVNIYYLYAFVFVLSVWYWVSRVGQSGGKRFVGRDKNNALESG